MNEFAYLEDLRKKGQKPVYLDSACQNLRPRSVVEALEKYYFEHNSCGERVKYPWGEKTDELVAGTRRKVLKMLKLRDKDYFVSFTLNTTYGINLILNQLKSEFVKKVVTSEVEHNSPFLATMALAEKLKVPRVILKRDTDGALLMEEGKVYPDGAVVSSDDAVVSSDDAVLEFDGDFSGAVVVVNCMTNFDGRQLTNLKEVVKRVHKDGGIIILDAAQAMAHCHEILVKTEADAICFSAHKMYAASLGVIVARRDLIPKLEQRFVGGGMVDDVFADHYLLSAENKDHAHTIFEPGLQAWGEIITLGAAIDWLGTKTKADKANLSSLAANLFEFLQSKEKVHLINEKPSTVMSFYVDGLDSHLLEKALGQEGIMARSGYFCVHYYLDKVLGLPPLIRFSLSYANTKEDIVRIKEVMKNI